MSTIKMFKILFIFLRFEYIISRKKYNKLNNFKIDLFRRFFKDLIIHNFAKLISNRYFINVLQFIHVLHPSNAVGKTDLKYL